MRMLGPTIREQEEALDPSVVERSPRSRRRLHMTLQGKGGIGKSHVARLLCEYFAGPKGPPTAYDMDAQNSSLAAIKPLGAMSVKVRGERADGSSGQIQTEALDEVNDLILADDTRDIVVDTGSWMYGHMLAFLEKSDIPDHLAAVNRDMWLHLIACGGAMQTDTMGDIARLINRWAGVANILLWDNEINGRVVAGKDRNLRGLTNTRIYQEEWKHRTKGVIRLAKPDDMFATDVASVLAAGETFHSVAADHNTSVSKRSRILRVFNGIADQLDVVFAPSALRARPVPDDAMLRLSEARLATSAETHVDDPEAVPRAAAAPDSDESQAVSDSLSDNAQPPQEDASMYANKTTPTPATSLPDDDSLGMTAQERQYQAGMAGELDGEFADMNDEVDPASAGEFATEVDDD